MTAPSSAVCGAGGGSCWAVSPAEPLIAVLEGFGDHYQPAVSDAVLWRLGVRPRDPESDRALVQAIESGLRGADALIDQVFFDGFGGQLPESYGAPFDAARAALAGYEPRGSRDHPYWRGTPCSMLIDEVEAIWAAIDERDDWSLFNAKVTAIREMGAALVA